MDITISKFIQSIKQELTDDAKVLGLRKEEIRDRVAVLKETLEKIRNFPNITTKRILGIMDNIGNDLLRITRARAWYGKGGKKLAKKKAALLAAVDLLLKAEAIPFGAPGTARLWTDSETKFLCQIKEKIELLYGLDEDALHFSPHLIKNLKSKKLLTRQFLLITQRSLFSFFREEVKVKPGRIYEIIGDLYYGVGLGKEDGADELRKLLSKKDWAPPGHKEWLEQKVLFEGSISSK